MRLAATRMMAPRPEPRGPGFVSGVSRKLLASSMTSGSPKEGMAAPGAPGLAMPNDKSAGGSVQPDSPWLPCIAVLSVRQSASLAVQRLKTNDVHVRALIHSNDGPAQLPVRHTHVDRVARGDAQIRMRHVVDPPVGHTNAEWFKRTLVQILQNILATDHVCISPSAIIWRFGFVTVASLSVTSETIPDAVARSRFPVRTAARYHWRHRFSGGHRLLFRIVGNRGIVGNRRIRGSDGMGGSRTANGEDRTGTPRSDRRAEPALQVGHGQRIHGPVVGFGVLVQSESPTHALAGSPVHLPGL